MVRRSERQCRGAAFASSAGFNEGLHGREGLFARAGGSGGGHARAICCDNRAKAGAGCTATRERAAAQGRRCQTKDTAGAASLSNGAAKLACAPLPLPSSLSWSHKPRHRRHAESAAALAIEDPTGNALVGSASRKASAAAHLHVRPSASTREPRR
jgi:hypothetical protein